MVDLKTLTHEEKLALARRIRRKKKAGGESGIPVKYPEAGTPLSFVQEGLWWVEEFEKNAALNNDVSTVFIKGTPDTEILEKAVNLIMQRHVILKTVYTLVDENPLQKVDSHTHIKLEWQDFSHLQGEASQKAITEYLTVEGARRFNLETGPLVRVSLVKLAEEVYMFCLFVHHIVFDGNSFYIFMDELNEFYTALSLDREPVLPELKHQYLDYVLWQRIEAHKTAHARRIDYWKRKLADSSLLEFRTDFKRPARPGYEGDSLYFTIPEALISRIKSFALENGLTVFVVLSAAYKLFLHKYTGLDDFVVGTPLLNRKRETVNMIGCFINMVPLRTKLQPYMSFTDLCRAEQVTILEAFDNEIPFSKLISEINPERQLGQSHLFQTKLNFQPLSLTLQKLHNLTLEATGFSPKKITTYDLSVTFWDNPRDMPCCLEFRPDLFCRETIAGMKKYFLCLLENIAADPGKLLRDIDILPAGEKQALLEGCVAEHKDYARVASVVEHFEAQVRKYPHAPAVWFGKKKITYKELNEKTNRLAGFLKARGVGPETKVAVYMDRSIELVMAMLGILKSGGAYVPFDPVHPADRIGRILEENGFDLVLADYKLKYELGEKTGLEILSFNQALAGAEEFSPQNPSVTPGAGNLMYIIFTSGSTGLPKGVEVENRGFLNYLHNFIDQLRIEERKRFIIASTFAADLGTPMIWGALATGGELHILGYDQAVDPLYFSEYIHSHKIDYMKIVPSHLKLLSNDVPTASLLPALALVLAGEACDWELVEKIRQGKTGCRIYNHYGPTETSVAALGYQIEEAPDWHSLFVPVGKPFFNTEVYILDQWLKPVPPGTVGEICIGGAGVSRGYLNNPEYTAEKFISHPFRKEAQARIYRTGDLGRMLPDHNIEFIGRIDNQVKVKGHRIELGDIESSLGSAPFVSSCLVVLREDNPGDKQLVAYVVPESGEFKPEKVRKHLQEHLPGYMIPGNIVVLESMPVTSNGKVDKKKLPAPGGAAACGEEFVPPVNESEAGIAGIWGEVLGLKQVSVTANFFQLGGDSFKALKVIRRMESSLGVMDMFKYPTVRELAEYLSTGSEQKAEMLLELTEPVAEKRRLASIICVPYGGGNAIVFQPLARALSRNISLFAVAVPGHDITRLNETVRPVKEVAAECVREILAKGLNKLVLYGHCLGGALAVEIARLLEKEDVELLGVIEAANFPEPRIPGKAFELWEKLFPREKKLSTNAYIDLLKVIGGYDDEFTEEELTFIVGCMRGDYREAVDYYTEVYGRKDFKKLKIPILVIVGQQDRMTELYEERYLEWGQFSDSVSLKVMGRAGHYFLKHQADELAETIHTRIEEWQQAAPACGEAKQKRVPATNQKKNMFAFFLVAFGQIISTIGTSLTSFALGIWVFQKTGRVLDFSLIALFAMIPGILVLPLSGSIADKYNKRKIMLVSDIVAAAGTVTVLVLWFTGTLEIWHLFITTAIGSITNSFQRPAYFSAISQLVPKRYYGQANGIIELDASCGQIIAPLLGAFFISTFGITGVFVFDIVTFLVAVITLALVKFPDVMFKKREEPILKELKTGIKYITVRKPFMTMIAFFVVYNIFLGMFFAIISPLVLSFGSPGALASVTSAMGIGTLAGSLLMILWGGFRRRATGMVGFVILAGFSQIIFGLRPFVLTTMLGAFGVSLALALVNTHWRSIIQAKVGLELQGRFLAVNQMMALSCMPLGYLLVGLLADNFFEPLMKEGGALVGLLGPIIGTGAGRGMGLFMVIIGLLAFIWGILGIKYKPLRYMEDDLPDAVPGAFIDDEKDKIQEEADRRYKMLAEKAVESR